MRARSKVLIGVAFSLLLSVALTTLALAHEGDVENGRALFGEYCAVCHGYDGSGRVGASLEGWFSSIDPEAFIQSTVSDGVAGTMPAFAQSNAGPLTDEEIDDIAAYILSWRERVEPAPTPTPVPVTPIPKVAGVTGDPTVGAQVFARECQVCHGAEGQGGIGASLSGPIAAAQPAAFLRQVISGGIEGSPMPAFEGVLSAEDIENTVAFVLSWDRTPVSSAAPATEEEDAFYWLFGLLFLVVALVVVVWLMTRFSQRKTPT
jgi:cytochrome c oxidase cbb3-type subunit 3